MNEIIDYEDASDFARMYNDVMSSGNALDATCVSPSEAMHVVLNNALKSLSTDQLKQLCEAKGLSVVEWVIVKSSRDLNLPPEKPLMLKLHNKEIPVIASTEWERCNPMLEPYYPDYLVFVDGDGEFLDIEYPDIEQYCELPQLKEN